MEIHECTFSCNCLAKDGCSAVAFRPVLAIATPLTAEHHVQHILQPARRQQWGCSPRRKTSVTPVSASPIQQLQQIFSLGYAIASHMVFAMSGRKLPKSLHGSISRHVCCCCNPIEQCTCLKTEQPVLRQLDSQPWSSAPNSSCATSLALV